MERITPSCEDETPAEKRKDYKTQGDGEGKGAAQAGSLESKVSKAQSALTHPLYTGQSD